MNKFVPRIIEDSPHSKYLTLILQDELEQNNLENVTYHQFMPISELEQFILFHPNESFKWNIQQMNKFIKGDKIKKLTLKDYLNINNIFIQLKIIYNLKKK